MSHINPYKAWAGSFVPNWLLERTEVSAAAKLLYARLSQFKGKGERCNPRQATLAKAIGFKSTRGVRKLVVELKGHGLIETVQNGLKKSNDYLFPRHPWMACERNGSAGPERTAGAAPEGNCGSGPIGRVDIGRECSSNEEHSLSSATTGSGYGQVVDHWFKAYERQYGVKPPMDSRRGKAIKSLLASCKNDAAEVCRLMDAYLDDADSFVANQKHPVHLIQMRMERYAETKQQVIRWTPSERTNFSER